MDNGKRLIDADALMEAHVWKCGSDPYDPYYMGYQDALDNVEVVIENLPTVDAVEVVRCKDCKHYVWDEVDGCHVCIEISKYVKKDFFCAYGERKAE